MNKYQYGMKPLLNRMNQKLELHHKILRKLKSYKARWKWLHYISYYDFINQEITIAREYMVSLFAILILRKVILEQSS